MSQIVLVNYLADLLFALFILEYQPINEINNKG